MRDLGVMATQHAHDRAARTVPQSHRAIETRRRDQRRRLCRTFSDCTTAPRKALPSGCYPLDPYYAGRPEAERLKAAKKGLRA